jgi:Tfp pilus assembly protein PilW
MRAQRGTTLIVAMLFLLVLSLFAVSSFNSSTTNTLMTGNMIARQENIAAAQWLIDTTISSAAFASDPKAVAAGTYPLDMDRNGTVDYQPKLTPAPICQRSRPLKAIELNVADDADVACMKSSTAGSPLIETGAVDPTAGDSLCASTEWNVRAVVDDPISGASVAVDQGVGIRVLATEAEDFCS